MFGIMNIRDALEDPHTSGNPTPSADPTEAVGKSHASKIIVGNIAPQVFAFVFVLARFYSRRLTRSYGLDDLFLLFSWIACIVYLTLAIRSVQLFDWRVADLPRQNLSAQEYYFFGVCVYEIAVALTQISICLFYLRLFGNSRPARVALRCATVAVLLHFIPAESLWVFHCNPVSGYWKSNAQAVCFTSKVGFYVHAVASVLVDGWLIAFAVPKIWALKMVRKQRIMLVFLVNSGWLVIVASIVHSYNVSIIVQKPDIAWSNFDLTIWSSVEICAALFCASAPTIRPLLQKLVPNLFLEPRSSSLNRINIDSSSTPPSTWAGHCNYRGDNPFDGTTYELQNKGNKAFVSVGTEEVQNEVQSENGIMVTHSISVIAEEQPASVLAAGGEERRMGHFRRLKRKDTHFWNPRGFSEAGAASLRSATGGGGQIGLEQHNSGSIEGDGTHKSRVVNPTSLLAIDMLH